MPLVNSYFFNGQLVLFDKSTRTLELVNSNYVIGLSFSYQKGLFRPTSRFAPSRFAHIILRNSAEDYSLTYITSYKQIYNVYIATTRENLFDMLNQTFATPTYLLTYPRNTQNIMFSANYKRCAFIKSNKIIFTPGSI